MYKNDMDYKYVDVVTEPEQYGTATIEVEFIVEVDGRSDGVKSVYPVLQKVTGSVFITDEDEKETEIDVKDFETDWENGEKYEDGIYPTWAEIDMANKKITITF
tara:strand:+ start:195 stop:506 length:312 start_codon:yes stop_codon:yes gene_type:complete